VSSRGAPMVFQQPAGRAGPWRRLNRAPGASRSFTSAIATDMISVHFESTMTPWLFALGTAVWFGLMALRAGRSWFGWAVGGAFFALVVSTIVLGISNAMGLPISHGAIEAHQVKSVVVTLVAVLVLGWVVTISLHRHPQRIWEAINTQAGGPKPGQSKPSS
jgi:hypothetical protein